MLATKPAFIYKTEREEKCLNNSHCQDCFVLWRLAMYADAHNPNEASLEEQSFLSPLCILTRELEGPSVEGFHHRTSDCVFLLRI